MTQQELHDKILSLVKIYCEDFHKQPAPWQEGERITYAARVYDHEEMCNLVDSSLEFWLTSGRYVDKFEHKLGKFLGMRYVSVVNSGSSANLLAFMALTSPLLGERRILPGDEVITVAAGFPTTVSPIINYGAVPVFVDVTIPQYNIDIAGLDNALSERTKAVMLAHTLGNPFDVQKVRDFCRQHGLWLIEDNCDALGSTCPVDGVDRLTGTVGDIGTSSFYPPHHITMGQGGAVYTDNPLLHKILRSFRDWGRDCVCPSGQDNICGHRFDGQHGELPSGYDHKYVYSHFGMNLNISDMQAAVGCAQLKKLPLFTARRRQNFDRLHQGLQDVADKFILPEPLAGSSPSWFGFLLTCRAGVKRDEVVRYLEAKGIQTRMLFAGNIVRQPCFDELRRSHTGYRIAGSLSNTDRIMQDTFWVGVYPGLTDAQIDYIVRMLKEAVKK